MIRLVSTLALLAGAAMLALPGPARAGLVDEPALLAPDAGAPAPHLARRGRGADDPPGHDAGDDRGRRGKAGGKGRGRGADDGPGHSWQDEDGGERIARRGRGRGRGADDGTSTGRRGRGADDPPGHDAGDDRGRRGRDGGQGRGWGADDGPGHT